MRSQRRPPETITVDGYACNDAATKSSMKTIKTYGVGNARFTAVCVPK